MEFFETFWVWLDGRLALYIGANTARVAAALTPVIILLGTLYVTLWGYLQLAGRIDEPFVAGLKRIVTLAVIFGVCLHLWLYNEVIVSTFYHAPAVFAATVVGASDPVQTVDAVWARGATVAENLEARTTLASGWSFTIMAYVIRVAVGALCVYTMFLIALSKVALAILIALGPMCIATSLFEATRSLFRSWLALLANYAFVTILTVMVCSLILGLVEQYATDTLARGAAILSVDALDLVLICALAFLFMLQVPALAATLGGGGGVLNTGSAVQWAQLRGRQIALGAAALGVIGARGGFMIVRRAIASRAGAAEPRTDWNSSHSGGANGRRTVSRNSIESLHS